MFILKVYKRTPHAKMTMPNLQRYPEKLRLIKDELDLPVFDYFIFSVKVTNFLLLRNNGEIHTSNYFSTIMIKVSQGYRCKSTNGIFAWNAI